MIKSTSPQVKLTKLLVPLFLVLALSLGAMTLALSSPKSSVIDSASAAEYDTFTSISLSSTNSELVFDVVSRNTMLTTSCLVFFEGELNTFPVGVVPIFVGGNDGTPFPRYLVKVPRSTFVVGTIYTAFGAIITGPSSSFLEGLDEAALQKLKFYDYNIKHMHFRYNPQPLPTPPTKPGFTFEGWYVDEALTQKYVGNELVVDTQLYAKYIPIIYTITFNTNYSFTVPTQSVQYEGLVTLPAFERYGHTFGGWFSDSTLTAAFDSATKVTENTTLYAKWIPITLIVTFYVDGEVWQTLEVSYGTTFEDPVLSVLLATGTIKNGDAVISSNFIVEENVELSYKAFSSFMTSWLKLGSWLESYWWTLILGLAVVLLGTALIVSKVKR